MSKLVGEGVLLVWLDLDEERQNELDRWYVDEHFPERISEVGYLRARRYRAIAGSPTYMSIMEAQTPAALLSEGYRRVTANPSARTRQMRGAFKRAVRSTHRVAASHSRASGGIMVCTQLRFADQPQRDAFGRWAQARLDGWMRAQPDVLAAHALALAPEVREEMDQLRPTGKQDEWADGVLLIELGRDTDFEGDLRRALSAESLSEAGVAVGTVSSSIYELMFAVGAGER